MKAPVRQAVGKIPELGGSAFSLNQFGMGERTRLRVACSAALNGGSNLDDGMWLARRQPRHAGARALPAQLPRSGLREDRVREKLAFLKKRTQFAGGSIYVQTTHYQSFTL